MLDPQVAARNSNFVSYANGDRPSDLIDAAIRKDRTIYPETGTMAKLFTIIAHDQKAQRLVNRLWTRIKTGE
jgi:putrescine transport system substrate-binding protein